MVFGLFKFLNLKEYVGFEIVDRIKKTGKANHT